MKTPQYFSVNEAAKETGRAKSTISKALKSGKLSYAKRDDSGKYYIEPSELFRAFPKEVEKDGNTSTTGNQFQLETPLETLENSILKVKLEALQERLSDKEKIIDDLRSERDEWRDEAKHTTRLLEHHAKANNPSKGLFGWFKKG